MNGFNVTPRDPRMDQMIHAHLTQLEDALKNKAVRAGLVKAIGPTKKAAKSLAPKKSGALAKAVGHKSISKRAKQRLGIAPDSVALLIGANRKVDGRGQGKKAHWNEEGTEHMEANPFLGPALEQTHSGFVGRFYSGLSNYLDRQGLL